MAAKITVRELVTKLTIGGNATDKLARFGLAVNGLKAGLDILVTTVKTVSDATIGLVKDVTLAGDAIAKTSRQAGLAAKEWQRLSFVADRSGAPLQNLKKGLQNIERNLRDAAIAAGKGKGTGFTAALAEVGVKLKEFEGLKAEEKLGLIGEALADIADKGRRAALSQKLVGEEAGPKLASLLEMTTAEIKAMGDEAERLGLVMSDDAIAASEAFQDSMTNMNGVLKGVKNAIGIALIPIVERAVKGFTKWLLLNKKFITSKFEKGVMFMTRAFSGLTDKLDSIVEFFEDLAELSSDVIDFFNDLSDTVGGLENLVRLATAAWVTYRIAAIAATVGLSLTPLGLLFTALGLIAVAFSNIGRTADDARIATSRFNEVDASKGKPVDDKAVSKDSKAIARRLAQGKGVGAGMRSRLASMSGLQATQTLNAARAIVTSSGHRSRAQSLKGGAFFQGGAVLPLVKSIIAGKASDELISAVGRSQGTFADSIKSLDDLESDISRERRDEGLLDLAANSAASLASRTRAGNERRGGRRSFKENFGGKADKEEDKTFEELMAEAIKSGRLPEAAALLTSTQPPIIITNTNINIQMDVDASMEFEGIAGESNDSLLERIREVATDVLNIEVRSAVDQINTQLAR